MLARSFRIVLSGENYVSLKRGVVLVELAIVIPLLILIIFAIYELGRSLSHIARVNQVAYSAGLRGAGMSDSGAPVSVATIAIQLYDASLKSPLSATPAADPSYDLASRLVTVHFDEGMLPAISPFFPKVPVALSVTLPWLVNPEGADIMDRFMSPFPRYCADGLECPLVPPPTPTPSGGCGTNCCWVNGVPHTCGD